MDRFTWGVVVGAVALVVAGLGSVLLLQQSPVPPDLSRPEGVVRAYVEALEQKKPEDAWELLSDSARARASRDQFIQRATASFPRERQGRLLVESTKIDGTVALVELSRTYSGGGGPFGLFGPTSYTDRQTVRLELERGQWRISVPPYPYMIDQRPFEVIAPATPPASPTATATPPPAATPEPAPAPSPATGG